MISSRVSFTALACAAVIAVVASPVGALDDQRQVLTAGANQVAGGTTYAGPGSTSVYGIDSPNTGLGIMAAGIRMPAGSFTNIRANVVTENTPTSGTFRIRLLKNGANTSLTCTTTGTGECNATQTINFAAGDRAAFKVTNTFPDSGFVSWNVSVEFN